MSHPGPDSRPTGLSVDHPDHPLNRLAAARASGIPWDQLADQEPSRPPDWRQHRQALSYLGFRSALPPEHDPVTVERGTVILRPPPGAGITEQVWGLKPGDVVDFGDLAEVLDQVARQIYRPGELTMEAGGGRHEVPEPAGSGDAEPDDEVFWHPQPGEPDELADPDW